MLYKAHPEQSNRIYFVRTVVSGSTQVQEGYAGEISRLENAAPVSVSLFMASYQSAHYGMVKWVTWPHRQVNLFYYSWEEDKARQGRI